jgi:hypothetical protein
MRGATPRKGAMAIAFLTDEMVRSASRGDAGAAAYAAAVRRQSDIASADNGLWCRLVRNSGEMRAILRLFGAEDSIARCRFSSAEQKAAFAAYDGLNQSPFTSVTVPVRDAAGNVLNKTFSIADMAKCDGSEPAIRRDCEALIQEAVNAGIVLFQRPADGEYQGLPVQSPYVMEPSRFVKFPVQLTDTYPLPDNYSGTGCNQTVSGIPDHWPVPQGFRQLYLNPKALKPSEVSNDTIMGIMERAVFLASAYCLSRNVNPAYHPTLIHAQMPRMPMFPPNGGNDHEVKKWARWSQGLMCKSWSSERSAGVCFPKIAVSPNAWRRDAIPGWNMPAPNATVGQSQPIIRGPSDGLWRESLSARSAVWNFGTLNGRGVYVWEEKFWTVHTDAVADCLSILVALQAMLDCGSYGTHSQGLLTDVNAACVVFNELQRNAYKELGLPYGTDFASFDNAVERERRQRELNFRSSLVQSFGRSGYQSTGDDTADILSATIGTAGLAIAAAVAAGPAGLVVAGLLLGVAVLLTVLGRPTPPPDKRRFGVLAKLGGACVWGGSAEGNRMAIGDILSPGATPVVRY